MYKGFKMKLFDGMKEEYKKRHDALWPEMKDLIHEHGGISVVRQLNIMVIWLEQHKILIYLIHHTHWEQFYWKKI